LTGKITRGDHFAHFVSFLVTLTMLNSLKAHLKLGIVEWLRKLTLFAPVCYKNSKGWQRDAQPFAKLRCVETICAITIKMS
jgi:hypothetical protein